MSTLRSILCTVMLTPQVWGVLAIFGLVAWVPPPSQTAFNGFHKIVARHSGKVLNVSGKSTANGAQIIQWPYGGGTNEEWELVDLGTGFHKVVARHSGKVLDVDGASKDDGANVIQWQSNDGQNQQWQITDLGNGFHRLTARHSGKALTVADASTANGAKVIQQSWANRPEQMWQLVSVGSSNLEGPGLPKLSFTQAELFKPLSTILPETASGEKRGNGLTTMHKGWFATVYGRDSGKSGGGFAFYDLSNPRSPRLVASMDVPSLREAHGFARATPGSYPGDYVVLQAGKGIEFWDWTDVTRPTLLKAMNLPGVDFSDYTVGAWWLAWQAPFVYVAGSGNGIFVVDATDPRNPTLVKQIPTSEIGGFRIHPIFVVGNLLVATSADFSGKSTGVLTMDISDPRNPTVIKAEKAGFPVFYSAFFNGNKLIGLGNRDHTMHVWDLSNPAVFAKVGQIGGMDRPVYSTVQDGHALVGDETSFVKIDIRSNNFRVVGEGTSGIRNRSEDIVTPLGNLAFVANDHGTGSAIIAHQAAPDTIGPSVTMVNPPNNARNQRLTSRVGVTLSDWIDLRSVNNKTFIVRPVGGSALTGKYSGEQGILNFWPDQPLRVGTTYEVVIPAGGIRDFSGNASPGSFTSRFSTTSIAGTGAAGAPTVQARANGPHAVGDTVEFDIADSSGDSLSYSWDFGDGTPPTPFLSGSTVSHSYRAPGHYAVLVMARNTEGEAGSSYTQAIHLPLPPGRPTNSSTIILDSGRDRVWTVNPDNSTVTAINGADNTKMFEKPVGANPRTLACAPDGTVWVVNQDDATISILDGDFGEVVETIALPPGSRPYGIAFAPNGAAVYVSTEGSRQLIKLDPATRAIVSTLDLRFPARGIAVSHDSARVLVTRFVSPQGRGEVAEVSGSTSRIVRTIALAFDPGPDGSTTGRGVPNYLSGIAISPDGRQARVPSKNDNTARGQFRDGQALDFETTVRTIVSYLDLGRGAEVLGMRVDLNDRDMADAVAFSPRGDYVFVATQGTNTIEVFSAYDNRLLTGIPDTGLAPQGLAFSVDGRKLYVQNFMSRSVSVYDVAGIVDSTTNSYTRLADISTVETEKLTAQVLKGKQIFYNAADRRMNLDGYLSCASCHLDGGSDERVWDFTDRGEGLRNTVMLRGRGELMHGNPHWTANFDEIQDFENDIRNHFGGLGFMPDGYFNTGTRRTPLGDPKNGISPELDALAAYIGSLKDVDRSPHRNPDGTMTEDGRAGRLLFNQLRCASCHAGRDFTDSQSGFLHDVGTLKPSSGQRMDQPLNGFDTPTLKGVWETGPYLHDGSSSTLLQVLTTANPNGAHGNVASLTAQEQRQLVSYLLQIDESEAAAAPSELFVAALSGSRREPPTLSEAIGRAKIVILDDERNALVSLQRMGLSGNEIEAHIHNNAGVLISLPNGSYKDYPVVLTPQDLEDLRNGKLYVDIHTSTHTTGEIHGQFCAAITPQPLPTTPYLSGRGWISAGNGWGPIERDLSNGEKLLGDGRTITLNGVTYTRGLGVHAPADVRFDLGGKCASFTASIGVDDEVGAGGSVIFQVWADSIKLYDSGPINGGTATQHINVNVSGRRTLQLVVTDGGNGNSSDHADWADARVECAGQPLSLTSSLRGERGHESVSVPNRITSIFHLLKMISPISFDDSR